MNLDPLIPCPSPDHAGPASGCPGTRRGEPMSRRQLLRRATRAAALGGIGSLAAWLPYKQSRADGSSPDSSAASVPQLSTKSWPALALFPRTRRQWHIALCQRA